MIEGVKHLPLRRIPDERGTVMHMLRRTDPHFIEFGEIYFSTVYAGVVKAWNQHRDMTLSYACVHGRIKVVVYDDRAGSSTVGEINEFFLGPDDYSLVMIPPGVWNGFTGMSHPESILANCCTHPHDPSRSIHKAPRDPEIPYAWETRER